jgi:hypothetical protein
MEHGVAGVTQYFCMVRLTASGGRARHARVPDMRTWRRRLTDIEAFESIYNPGKLLLLGPFVALLLVY